MTLTEGYTQLSESVVASGDMLEFTPPEPRIYITLDERGLPVTVLEGGVKLAWDEVPAAMKEARDLIQTLGTTAADYAWDRVGRWMEKYFPNWT